MGLPVPFVAAGLSVAVLGAVNVDGSVGGRAEMMAGSAPVTPSGPTQAAAAAELSPGAAFQLQAARWRLASGYSLRIFYRRPNALELDRPLFLHRGSIAHSARLTRTLTLETGVDGSIGEVDYTETGAVFDPTQTSQLEASVIDFYDVEARTALRARLDRRNELIGSARAGQSDALDAGTGLPSHTHEGAGAEYRHRLTRIDDVHVPVTVEHDRIDDTQIISLGSELAWRRRVSRRTITSTAVGAVYAQPISDGGDGSMLPTAAASVAHAILRAERLRLDGRAAVSLRGALDVLRAEYRPMLGFDASTELGVFPDWTVALRAALYTAATSEPLGTGEPETTFTAEAPVLFTATRELSLEAGARTGWRSPHWSEGFDVEQFEVWVYVAVVAVFGTVERGPPPPPPM